MLNDNGLDFNLHSGQVQAWESETRFNFIFAGTQSGKTSFLPWWLAKEIGRTADPRGGANDYIAATATYDLFKLKFLPEMLNTFEGVTNTGRYWAGLRIIELRDPTTGEFWAKRADKPMWGRIIMRAASVGGGLESSSSRAAILDECGLPEFGIEIWEAVLRRLSLYSGRVLAGTTLYDIGFLKTEIYDRFARVGTEHEQPGDRDFLIINFDSTENPMFPRAEFERARLSMPEWRFNMMYRGRYTRPAGQIYDCFIDADVSEGGHRMRPKPIPDHWHRVAGIDFGVVNTCVGFYAVQEDEDGYPTGKLILTRTYHAGGHDATGHVVKIKEIEPRLSLVTGGAASEDQWRRAYLWAGLPIYAPAITEVEVGIDRVYGATKQGRLLVHDTEQEFIQQKKNYSRVLDDRGEPTIEIKDKEKFHRLDQERYLAALMCPTGATFLPFDARRHLIIPRRYEVGQLPLDIRKEAELEPRWTRFGGLYYQEGAPSAFVLCVVDEDGKVVADREIAMPGLGIDDFAKAVAKRITNAGLKPENVLIAANDDLFKPLRLNDINGPALVESLYRAGLSVVKAGADGSSEWSACVSWMVHGTLKINRARCPVLSLTLPLIVSDVKDTSKPDRRNPLATGLALCYALMTRPQPSPKQIDVKPKTWRDVKTGIGSNNAEKPQRFGRGR